MSDNCACVYVCLCVCVCVLACDVQALRDALVSLRQARHTAGVQAREAVLREAMDTITQV